MKNSMLLLVVIGLGITCSASACISSGSDFTIQSALNSGGDAVLCAGSTFTLYSTINFVYPNTTIYTEGLPTGTTRALLRVSSSSLQKAINARDIDGAQLLNVRVDGNRTTYGYVTGAPELIDFGGNASNQIIDHVEAYEPRGWTAVHVIGGSPTFNGSAWVGGCSGAQVTNNSVHNAGSLPAGHWADGISYDCHDGYVGYNIVNDATDGGIVVFGSPMTTIEYNTIRNYNKTAFGGLNMVDGSTYLRTVSINGINTLVSDYSGTIVRNNTIDSGNVIAGKPMIQVGLGMGPHVWFSSCSFPANSAQVAMGASVVNNDLIGPNFYYGFVVDGVHNWSVSGNSASTGNLAWPYGGSDCGTSNQLPYMFSIHSSHITSSSIQNTLVWYGDPSAPVHDGLAHSLPNSGLPSI